MSYKKEGNQIKTKINIYIIRKRGNKEATNVKKRKKKKQDKFKRRNEIEFSFMRIQKPIEK